MPQGMHVADACMNRLATYKHTWPSVPSVLQLGVTGGRHWMPSKHTTVLTPCLDYKRAQCIASPLALPLKKSSIDIILAPFLFEVFDSKADILASIESVINPMGYVVLFGFNPISLWGLALKTRRISRLSQKLKLHNPLTIKHFLQSHGYAQIAFESFYYIPPFKRDALIRKLGFLNEMGKMMSLFPPGFYLLIMQKHQVCPTKLMERAREDSLWVPSA